MLSRNRSAREPGSRSLGFALALLMLIHLGHPGCGAPAKPPDRPSQRVASLDPLATRLILMLGQADRIVAVDAASADLPGLERRSRIPTDDETAYQALIGAGVDLVVLPFERIELSQRLNNANIRTVISLIHDFDDGFTLLGEIAGRLGVAASARTQIADLSRPFAEIAAESQGRTRPRVAVIESFEPLALVGDHRFATALVEIAGGESVTHGREGASIPIERSALEALAPELLLYARPEPIDEADRRALVESVAEIAPLVVVELDPARFAEPSAVAAARTLRAAIAPRARPLEAAGTPAD